MVIDIPLKELYIELLKVRDSGGMIISQPLGFYRIFLTAKDALSPGLMLHAWLDASQPRQSGQSDIHSHTFNLTSRVLVGELINELYEVVPDPKGEYKLVNVYHDGVKSVRIVSDTLVTKRQFRQERVKEGQTYSFESKIFHSTSIAKYPTITLMEKTNLIKENAVNIIKADYSEVEVGEYKYPIIDQEIVWNTILDSIKFSNETNLLKDDGII